MEYLFHSASTEESGPSLAGFWPKKLDRKPVLGAEPLLLLDAAILGSKAQPKQAQGQLVVYRSESDCAEVRSLCWILLGLPGAAVPACSGAWELFSLAR